MERRSRRTQSLQSPGCIGLLEPRGSACLPPARVAQLDTHQPPADVPRANIWQGREHVQDVRLRRPTPPLCIRDPLRGLAPRGWRMGWPGDEGAKQRRRRRPHDVLVLARRRGPLERSEGGERVTAMRVDRRRPNGPAGGAVADLASGRRRRVQLAAEARRDRSVVGQWRPRSRASDIVRSLEAVGKRCREQVSLARVAVRERHLVQLPFEAPLQRRRLEPVVLHLRRPVPLRLPRPPVRRLALGRAFLGRQLHGDGFD
mmetsp:Transcript_55358/g.160697  ORF Transcript_55358/g.160697 Transcript_55358/m.160697 type:complete len:259 (-) Transcript_55358:298-1074(-)